MSSSSGMPWRMMVPSHASWLPIITMSILSTMGHGWSHLSSTRFLLGARVLVNLLMQHIQNFKYLFLILHSPLIIFPIYLHFSMLASHSYGVLLVSSSISHCLSISHANMQTSKFLFVTVGSRGIFHSCSSHIGTKIPLWTSKLCIKCACKQFSIR